MKKVCFIIALILLPCLCHAYDVQYEKSDSLRVINLLTDARRQNGNTNFIIFFARKLLGIPYVAHTLEVNKTEKLVVNLRQLDCTTFVENVVALSLRLRRFAIICVKYVIVVEKCRIIREGCIILRSG